MAVANPRLQTEWDEWKNEMEDDGEDEEEEDVVDWAEEEVSEDEEDIDVDDETKGAEGMEYEGEIWAKEVAKEQEEVDNDEGKVTKEGEQEEEKVDDLEKGVKENLENAKEEESDMDKAYRPMEEDLEEEGGVVNREAIGNEEVEVVEEFERGPEENDVERAVHENGEVKEEELTEAKKEGEEQERERESEREVEKAEKRAEEGENEIEVGVEEEEARQSREEEDDEREGYQIRQHHLLYQFLEQIRGFKGQEVQVNQEGAMQAANEEENFSVSGMSDYAESDFMGFDEEYFRYESPESVDEATLYKDLEVPQSIPVKWTSKESNDDEDRCEKPQKETVAQSKTIQEEDFRDDRGKVQEEEDESTEDEDAENSTEEEPDTYDEEAVKIYSKDDYLMDVFGILTEFKDSSLLTDLTLSTEDGTSIQVHSLVLAAVSSRIHEKLRSMEDDCHDEGKDDHSSVRVSTWSLHLGPDVDRVGLEAVVEFAYTGNIDMPYIRERTLYKIKAAAEAMGAPGVLDLCMKKEEMSTKPRHLRKDERILAAEQMRISLQWMKQLWMDGVGCDVVLDAVGGSLHVHRVILAVGSDYFRSMFTLGMRESNQPCVTLPFLLASELQILIGCSYSGNLPLSWKSVFEITSTALQLQYQPALSLCLSFLQQEINPHSCLDVAAFAEAYEMAQLLEVADDYVLRQFQKVSCTSKFKDLPAKHLLKYLNSHSLCVPSELVVFKAVVAWIEAKPRRRLRLAKELMKTIHFPLMTFKEFKEVQSLTMWSDHRLAELFEAIFYEFCSTDVTAHSQCRIYLPKESLVVIGGDQTSEDLGTRSISRELWFGNSLRNHMGIRKATEWRKLGEMPESGRFRHEVCVLNGKLYVFGGKKYYGRYDTLRSVYRYDPIQDTWESLADMLQRRSAFSVVVLDGKMLAIGGHCDPDHEDSVEQYCPTTNSWRFTWPLDMYLSGHVARVLGGQVYISGGLNNNYQCISTMFLYHPDTGSTYLANMSQPRAYHCMEVLGEWLYVAGGLTTDENMTAVDQLACEVYCPAYDTWTAFTPLPVPHVGAGSAVLEGKFYVLGGYSQEDYSDVKMVHRFDPSTQRWENMGKMPGPNNDLRASLLCLPQHFRL